MSLHSIEYRNWKNCLLLENGTIELVVSLDLGPRILSFKRTGGVNFLKNFDDQMANVSPDMWQSYGGHRLWHAPEVWPRTYYPDVQPVKHVWDGSRLILTCEPETDSRLQKEIHIVFPEKGNQVTIFHRIYNRGSWAAKYAVWAITVMAPGGTAIIPQEPYVPHGSGEGQSFSAGRPLVLWQFTDMSDPRFTWGKRFIRMRQDDRFSTKQKIGGLIKPGWAGYAFGEEFFIKRFPYIENAPYTDYGCNGEYYTEPGMLEIESLAPETVIQPGAFSEHCETWQIESMTASPDDDTLAEQIRQLGL